MKENEDIKKAVIEVRKMSEDDKLRRLADLREKARMDEIAIYEGGLEKGIKRGLEQGLEQGIEQGKKIGREEERKQRDIEIVQKLYKMNTPIEQIAEIVELKEDDVKKILKFK